RAPRGGAGRDRLLGGARVRGARDGGRRRGARRDGFRGRGSQAEQARARGHRDAGRIRALGAAAQARRAEGRPGARRAGDARGRPEARPQARRAGGAGPPRQRAAAATAARGSARRAQAARCAGRGQDAGGRAGRAEGAAAGGEEAPVRRTAGLWIALAICLLRIPSFIRPILDDDEAQYAAIAALLRAGGRLHADGGVDFKFPGISWTYAAVFAVAGRYAMWAVHLVSLAAVLGTAAALARLGRRLTCRRAGLLAALFYGVFSTVFYDKMLAANTEPFMMLALTWAVVFLIEGGPRRALVAGALIGDAFA